MAIAGVNQSAGADLVLGAVELTVASLDRSLNYYTRSIGLQVLDQEARNSFFTSGAAAADPMP